MAILSASMLKSGGSSERNISTFRELFGEEVNLNAKLMSEYQSLWSFTLSAKHFLSPENLEKYLTLKYDIEDRMLNDISVKIENLERALREAKRERAALFAEVDEAWFALLSSIFDAQCESDPPSHSHWGMFP